MERDDETMLNTLLETIRKEFNTIIENESNAQPSKKSSSKIVDSNSDKTEGDGNKMSDMDGAQKAMYLQSSTTLDEDFKRMQQDLQKSYELFQTIGNKFETMNFGMLKNRVKNLHTSLSANGNDIGTDAIAELKQLFQQSYLDNRVNTLTAAVSEKLHRHPGEFGDIPEVSAFFKACSQLTHGLEQLRRQREQVTNLGQRLCGAAEISFDRVNEIRKLLENEEPKGVVHSPDEVYQLPE